MKAIVILAKLIGLTALVLTLAILAIPIAIGWLVHVGATWDNSGGNLTGKGAMIRDIRRAA